MFTGIVECTGTIQRIQRTNEGIKLIIKADFYIEEKLSIGESIAVDGVCLTVTKIEPNGIFYTDVSPETLKLTTIGKLKVGSIVNLERALTPSSRLGGHIVSGHVDATTPILSIQRRGNFFEWTIKIPSTLAKYVANKGSIAISGVSLTINGVENDKINLMLIPHTLKNTSLELKKVGDEVNIEVDVLARYVERLMQYSSDKANNDSKLASLLID